MRRCDGSFTYDGGDQYGAGSTGDNTYYGRSSYDGLSPAATYVLTYSLYTGSNGCGKTHELGLCEEVAVQQGLVVARAELTPESRFEGNHGEARLLLSKLLGRIRMKGPPPGSGLESLLNCLRSKAVDGQQGSAEDLPRVIQHHCRSLLVLTGGDDLVQVVVKHRLAQDAGDLMAAAKSLRWLRAEYASGSQAAKDLGVSGFIRDSDFLSYLKLLARLCQLAGYRGLLVLLDELTVLTRNLNGSVRQANFDVRLDIVNDCFQGLDVTLGEDHSRVHNSKAAFALSLFRRVAVSFGQAWLEACRKINPRSRATTRKFQKRFLHWDGGPERLQALIFCKSPVSWCLPK